MFNFTTFIVGVCFALILECIPQYRRVRDKILDIIWEKIKGAI